MYMDEEPCYNLEMRNKISRKCTGIFDIIVLNPDLLLIYRLKTFL